MTSLKWCKIIPEQVVRLHLLSGYCGFMSCLTRVRDCFGSCALTSYCQGGLRLPWSPGALVQQVIKFNNLHGVRMPTVVQPLQLNNIAASSMLISLAGKSEGNVRHALSTAKTMASVNLANTQKDFGKKFV
jgi:hypothetical protein